MYRIVFSLYLLFFTVSCSSCAIFSSEGFLVHQKRRSVGIIASQTFLTITTKPTITKTSTTPITFSTIYSSSGTGTVVQHNDKTSFILTAAHVCTVAYDRQIKSTFPFYNREEYEKSFIKLNIIYDVTGSKHRAVPFVWNNAYDICIMVTPKIDFPALSISYEAPYPGEKAYYMGFPRGIGGGNFVPAFSGFYLGTMSNRNPILGDVAGYSVPVAPGSSGSAVLNIYGDIIGVIHSYIPAFSNIGLSATHRQIEILLEKANEGYETRKQMVLSELGIL